MRTIIIIYAITCAGCHEPEATGPFDQCGQGRQPETETCDGKDNDCDGLVDEDVPPRPCRTACGLGTEVCRDAAFAGCTAPQPVPETCNAVDDDCDGAIDEWQDLPLEACWTGPVEVKPWSGDCHLGMLVCEGGRKVCRGESWPTTETCDGRDNDCDGAVDEDWQMPVNVCFVLDTSGSMPPYETAMRQAIHDWAVVQPSTTRACLILAPPGGTDRDKEPRVVLAAPMGATLNMEQALQNEISGDGHWNEPTLDALWWIADGTLGVHPDVVVMLSDEPPYAPLTGRGVGEVKAALAAADAGLYTFTNANEPFVTQQWETVALGVLSLADITAEELGRLTNKVVCE